MADDKYAFPKDIYQQPQWTMTVVHETLKNAFNSIYGHMENPPMNDLDNFLSYCILWTEIIEKHHGVEERYFFVELQKKLDFSIEVEQHKEIHEKLDKLSASFKAAKADHSKFDASALRVLMQSFKEVLFVHLDQEVQDLAAERLKVFTEAELKAITDGLDNEAKKEGGLVDVMPFVFGNIPAEYKPHFPPHLPGLIRNIVLPYIIAPIHRGWWKYCPNKP